MERVREWRTKFGKCYRKHKKLSFCIAVLKVCLLIVLLAFICVMAVYWHKLLSAVFPNTVSLNSQEIEFIRCYPINTVKMLNITKAQSTVIYSGKKSQLSRAIYHQVLNRSMVADDKEIIDYPVHLNYYGEDPLYSVEEGYIVYKLSVELNGTNSCAVEVLVFDNHTEFENFLQLEKYKPINRTCLAVDKSRTNNATLNYTLPSGSTMYFGAFVKANVMMQAYANGVVSVYEASELNHECSAAEHCIVKITKDSNCLLAELGGSTAPFNLQIEVSLLKTNRYTTSFTAIAGSVLLVMIVMLIGLTVLCCWPDYKQPTTVNEDGLINDTNTTLSDNNGYSALLPGDSRNYRTIEQEEKQLPHPGQDQPVVSTINASSENRSEKKTDYTII